MITNNYCQHTFTELLNKISVLNPFRNPVVENNINNVTITSINILHKYHHKLAYHLTCAHLTNLQNKTTDNNFLERGT